MTTAVLLTLFGALSRLLPHPPNAVALGAVALYAGARLPRRLAFAVPLLAMALSDLVIDWGTGRPALTPIRAAVYGCFALTVLLGRIAAARAGAVGLARLVLLATGSAVFFFAATNFANWLQFDTYPHTAAGLAICYLAAIPWFWNTLAADLAGTAVLFGLDALARRVPRRTRQTAALVGALLLLCASGARAQQTQAQTQAPPPQAGPPYPSALSETVVVSATAVPEEQSEIGSATTVITRQDIDRHGYRTVSEVLRAVPGLDVARSGAEGSLTSVFLRGANSTGALVLVDGARLNYPSFGGYDFSTLTTEAIERIEIVRGPFSALYGSDALGGVIQIFTRAAGTGLSGRASVEAGNAGAREGEASASYGSGPWGFSASVRDGRIDGDRANSDWRQKSGAVRIENRPAEGARVALEGSIVDGEVGVPGPVSLAPSHARSTWREERLALPVSFRPAEGHQTTVLVASVTSRPTFSDPNPDFPFFGKTRNRSLQARAGDTWTAGSNRLTGFASWERDQVDDSSNFGQNLQGQHTSIWGVGLEDSIRVSDRITATAGARYDRHSQFGSAWSPRATLAWRSADSLWKLRASGGSAFRAPSVGELYYPFSGNPDLKPERSVSWEAGAERAVGNGRAEVSLFWNDFRDLIVYDFARAQDFNVGRARARGIETVFRQELGSRVGAEAGYTYLDSEDRGSGEALIRRPRHRAFFSLALRPFAGLTVSPRATFVGVRRDANPASGIHFDNPSYVRYDLFARFAIGRVAPYVRLENLTDRRYDEAAGYPAAHRRFVGGIEAGF
jgi:vitamin B12 transporter